MKQPKSNARSIPCFSFCLFAIRTSFLSALFLFLSLAGGFGTLLGEPLFLCAEESQIYPFVGEVTAQNYLNIRAGQSTSFEKVGKLLSGEKVVVVDQDYSWYKIKLPENADSYVSAQFIKVLGEGIAEVQGGRVNIRARGQIGASILGQIEKGVLIRVLEEPEPEAEWHKIEPVDESYGWVSVDFIKRTDMAVPPPRVVQLPTRNIYVKKQLAEQKEQAEAAQAQAEAARREEKNKNLISLRGIIVDVNQTSLSSDIRHRIVLENNESYYLKGYRRLFDIFLHNKVNVEGVLLPDADASIPVLFVSKISYVL